MNTPNILNSVVIFTLDGIHLTTGKKTMTPNEFQGINEHGIILPPEKIASLGTKQILDPKKINALRVYKTRAEAVCIKYGVPFLNGYAVPSTLADEVRNRLNDIKTDFYYFKDDFIRTVADDFLNWLGIEDDADDAESAVVKKLFAGECVDVNRLKDKLQFGYSSFTVSPYGDGEQEEKTQHLKDAVLEDVCVRAKSIVSRDNFNSRNIGQVTINVLKDMQSKLYSLATVSKKVRQLSEYLDTFIKGLPTEGILNDNDSFSVCTMLVTLSDLTSLNNLISATNTSGIPASQMPENVSNETNDSPQNAVIVDVPAEAPEAPVSSVPNDSQATTENVINTSESSEFDYVLVEEEKETESVSTTDSVTENNVDNTQDETSPAELMEHTSEAVSSENQELTEEELALAAQYY